MPEGRDRSRILPEAGMAIASELSLDAVLHRIIELAVQVTDATFGALGVLGSGGLIVDFITTGISDETRRSIGHLPVGRGILGLLIREARPLRIPDIARDPRSVGFPPNHPPMRSFLGAPVRFRGKVYGNIYLTEKRGAPDFDQEDESDLLVLAAQAAVAVENAVLHEEARRREQGLRAVNEVSEAILSGGSSDAVLQTVVGLARRLVEAEVALVAVPSGGGSLIVIAADGRDARDLAGAEFALAGSVSETVIETGGSVVLVDASADPRTTQPHVRSGAVGPTMFVPLTAAEGALGTLTVGRTAGGRAFSAEDLELVESFARQASVALEYARARRELERLVILEDRERIAKELHDGVIQSLFAVGMGLQAAATLSRNPDIETRVEASVADIDRVIRDLRNYIFGLRPGILADRQLDQALRHLAEDFQEKNSIVAVVDVDTGVAAELGSRAGDVVQLIREALSNVARHSGAATCRVSLQRKDGAAVIEVDDDGRGFDPSADSAGNGLRNLSERVASMGGSLEISSEAGAGTLVRAVIPM